MVKTYSETISSLISLLEGRFTTMAKMSNDEGYQKSIVKDLLKEVRNRFQSNCSMPNWTRFVLL